MIKTNVPSIEARRVIADNGKFKIGDKVRVLLKNKNEYLGKLVRIDCGGFFISTALTDKMIVLSEIDKIRLAEVGEDMDKVEFFDDEEAEFWRNHIISRDGIRERTEEERANVNW